MEVGDTGAGGARTDGVDPDPSESEDGGRRVGKLRLLRWLVMLTLAGLGLLLPLWPSYELLILASTREETGLLGDAPLWPSVVALVLGLFGALIGLLMIRERMGARHAVDPRLYWGFLSVLVLMCLFLRVPLYIFCTCAGAWGLLIFMAPRSRTRFMTLGLLTLAWVASLAAPQVHSLTVLVGHFAIALVFTLIFVAGCVPIFWMWDTTRDAVEGARFRARLAVTEERLRFAEDVRGMLGHELNALQVRAHRAGSLLRTEQLERAREEIDRVHGMARATLQKVRAVVRGYRDLDLDTEIRAVRAVLEQNGTATTVSGVSADAGLLKETAALAAWVVREGGTNVLRHSRARHCRIEFSLPEPAEGAPRSLLVEMTNDGAETGTENGPTSYDGLTGLAERVERGGGTLTASRTFEDGFLLRALLPLSTVSRPSGATEGEDAHHRTAKWTVGMVMDTDSPENGAGSKGRPTAEGGSDEETGPSPWDEGLSAVAERSRADRRIRISRRITVVILGLTGAIMLLWPFFDLVFSTQAGGSYWAPLLGLAATVVNVVLLVVLLRERMAGTLDSRSRLYWASLGSLALTAILLHSPVTSLFAISTWWGVGVFLTDRRTSLRVSIALLFSPLPLLPTYTFPVSETNFLLYGLVWLGAVVFALFLAASTIVLIWLWDVTREAVEGQRTRARLAVTEERLRFARDMHDLLGHSLSALAVKAQLAGRLVDRAPKRAITEMDQVQELAGTALHQVRSAVNGYWEADLGEEVASIASILEAAGTRTTVSGLGGLRLPPRVAALAAWVVREAGTNVLRHSDAQRCQITFTPAREDGTGPGTLVLEVHNDRAEEPKTASDGNGLTGLSERVAAGGGTVSTARTREGGFLLRAVLPLSTGPGQDTVPLPHQTLNRGPAGQPGDP